MAEEGGGGRAGFFPRKLFAPTPSFLPGAEPPRWRGRGGQGLSVSVPRLAEKKASIGYTYEDSTVAELENSLEKRGEEEDSEEESNTDEDEVIPDIGNGRLPSPGGFAPVRQPCRALPCAPGGVGRGGDGARGALSRPRSARRCGSGRGRAEPGASGRPEQAGDHVRHGGGGLCQVGLAAGTAGESSGEPGGALQGGGESFADVPFARMGVLKNLPPFLGAAQWAAVDGVSLFFFGGDGGKGCCGKTKRRQKRLKTPKLWKRRRRCTR